jgi:hypothetical protein
MNGRSRCLLPIGSLVLMSATVAAGVADAGVVSDRLQLAQAHGQHQQMMMPEMPGMTGMAHEPAATAMGHATTWSGPRATPANGWSIAISTTTSPTMAPRPTVAAA